MKNKRLPFNLQFFAEPTDPPAPPAAPENPPTDPPEPPAEPEKKYSDADLDKIINDKFARWQTDKEKEIDEAKKLANLTEQEKAAIELDQITKQLEELKKANTLNEMSKTARKILSENGVAVDDDILSILVSSDADATKTAVDNFATLFKKAVDDAVKEKLKNPAPKAGKGAVKMTREQIMGIKDRVERQKAIQDNMELFN